MRLVWYQKVNKSDYSEKKKRKKKLTCRKLHIVGGTEQVQTSINTFSETIKHFFFKIMVLNCSRMVPTLI